MLFHKQGYHYGTEAINAIIEYGYKNVGLKSIDVNLDICLEEDK